VPTIFESPNVVNHEMLIKKGINAREMTPWVTKHQNFNLIGY